MTKLVPKLLRVGFLPKLLLACFFIAALHDTFWSLWSIDKFQTQYQLAAETKTKEEVDIAYSVITRWHDLEVAGSLSRTEAQASALAELTDLQYASADADGHFWITDQRPVLLADASRPDLVNTDVGNLSDEKGNLFFTDAVDIVASRGEGYCTSY
jgi:methyl-accepting chemotaxis protein